MVERQERRLVWWMEGRQGDQETRRPGCSRALEAPVGFYPQSNGQPLEGQKGRRLLEHSQEGQEVRSGVRAIFLLRRLPCGVSPHSLKTVTGATSTRGRKSGWVPAAAAKQMGISVLSRSPGELVLSRQSEPQRGRPSCEGGGGGRIRQRNGPGWP